MSSRKIVVTGILGAITIVLGMTPLGFIPLGILNATTMHIPVIVAAIVEGPIVGAIVGLIFGLSSLGKALTSPGPMSPIFYNPLISVVPRILIGITTYYTYKMLRGIDQERLRRLSYVIWTIISGMLIYTMVKNYQSDLSKYNLFLLCILTIVSIGMLVYTYKRQKNNFAIVSAAFVGSMTNSILVMGGIYVIYAAKYMQMLGQDPANAGKAIMGVIVMQSLPEAIISCIIVSAIIQGLRIDD